MDNLSPKWKWFGLGCLFSMVLAGILTRSLLTQRLANMGAGQDMELPFAMVAASWLMTYFGLLVPMIAALAVVVVIVDGYARGRSEPPAS